MDPTRLKAALNKARRALLEARQDKVCWAGDLSSSALSTATAVTALALLQSSEPLTDRNDALGPYADRIRAGRDWLVGHQNPDGGWGDTTRSRSNISTTTLVWASLGGLGSRPGQKARCLELAEAWLQKAAGSLDPGELARAIIQRYGKDRTFSVPILTLCALAGRLGPGKEAWRHVIPLPFELAALPPSWFAAVRLPVVSYALPALIAIGQVRFDLGPPVNPFSRLMRSITRRRTLRVLESIQPSNGGFLEATPLTSFVTMSLAGMGLRQHPVARRGRDFLLKSQRTDGSWPIDTNLATWLTTLSVNALGSPLPTTETALADWLLDQQYLQTHPYTQAAPGGWAWTDLPGGVPDADDTAGALLALNKIRHGLPSGDRGRRQRMKNAREKGLEWLMNLQNRDGGIPTFCRGWGALPFDRSSPDLTAHALRAWIACEAGVEPSTRGRLKRATGRALAYLAQCQRANGSWVPLWFGNQDDAQEENPLYGTSRVLLALTLCLKNVPSSPPLQRAARRGIQWILQAQNTDGSWGGNLGIQGSVEETALGIEALAALHACPALPGNPDRNRVSQALHLGLEWLVARVESGTWTEPAPIGFYFAKLWYYERLYPLIFTAAALSAADGFPTANEP